MRPRSTAAVSRDCQRPNRMYRRRWFVQQARSRPGRRTVTESVNEIADKTGGLIYDGSTHPRPAFLICDADTTDMKSSEECPSLARLCTAVALFIYLHPFCSRLAMYSRPTDQTRPHDTTVETTPQLYPRKPHLSLDYRT